MKYLHSSTFNLSPMSGENALFNKMKIPDMEVTAPSRGHCAGYRLPAYRDIKMRCAGIYPCTIGNAANKTEYLIRILNQ